MQISKVKNSSAIEFYQTHNLSPLYNFQLKKISLPQKSMPKLNKLIRPLLTKILIPTRKFFKNFNLY